MNPLQIAVLELKAVLQSNKNREKRVNSTLISARFIVIFGREGKLTKTMPHKAIFWKVIQVLLKKIC